MCEKWHCYNVSIEINKNSFMAIYIERRAANVSDIGGGRQ